MNEYRDAEKVSTIVIGGGQAGLTMGYQLARRNISFRILDAHDRIGDAWRRRWDSLRLFTPARYAGLPGMPFPNGDAFLGKDALADYLESYAEHFRLPVSTGMKVQRLSKKNGKFLVETEGQRFEADQVIVQVHSHHYKNPSQLKPGNTLVVGAGNSGADIAMEVVKTHPTWMSGKESGHVPFQI